MRFRLHGSIAIVMMPRVGNRSLIIVLVVAGCSSPNAGMGPDSGPGGGSSTDGGRSDAPPAVLPIKHVVVVVKENHTFDNYFGSFPGAEGTSTYKTSDGMTHPVPHAQDKVDHDMSHAHSAAEASARIPP